jgi:hypothetical protein
MTVAVEPPDRTATKPADAEACNRQPLPALASAFVRSSGWGRLTFACAVATAVPLWVGRYLPFADLPEHVAMIATLRHWWDPAWGARQTFTLAAGQTQYLLYYLVGALLSFAVGTAERANLVLLSAIAIAFPYSLRSLLRATGRDDRPAILGCPLFWSMPLLIGLLNYVAAVPLVVWGLAIAIRQAERPTARRAVMLALISVLLFYLHLSALFFFFAASALCFLLWPAPESNPSLARILASRMKMVWRKLAWMIPAAALCLSWLLTSPVVRPTSVGWREKVAVGFQTPRVALARLPQALLDIWRGNESRWLIVLWLFALLLLAWRTPQRIEDSSSRWQRRALGTIALLALVLYFAMPYTIGWLWWLNARYAILAALLLPAVAPAPQGTKGTLSLLMAAGVALCVAGSAALHVRAFQREANGFERVLLHARPGQRLFSMIYDEESHVARFIPYHHFGSYYRARSGGIAEFSFANLPQSAIRYRPEVAPPARPPSSEWDPSTFRNEVDGAYYDYVLVRGNVDTLALKRPGPSWRLAAREGLWALYEKDNPRTSGQ